MTETVKPLTPTELANMHSALEHFASLIEEAEQVAARVRGIDYTRRLVVSRGKTASPSLPDLTTMNRATRDVTAYAYRARICLGIKAPIDGRPLSWLTEHVQSFRTWGEARDLYVVLGRHIAALTRSIDVPADRVYVGECDHCGNRLMAVDEADTVTCRRCHAGYDVADRRAALIDHAREVTLTATACARLLSAYGLPVKAPTVRQWAKRGGLVARGVDEAGDPVYRLGDVADRAEPARVVA